MEDSKLGEPIWDILFEAGANMDVKAGCPNLIERIEAGLLSYGNDMTNDHTPHQSGLSKFCDTKKAIKCVGSDALLEEINNLDEKKDEEETYYNLCLRRRNSWRDSGRISSE